MSKLFRTLLIIILVASLTYAVCDIVLTGSVDVVQKHKSDTIDMEVK